MASRKLSAHGATSRGGTKLNIPLVSSLSPCLSNVALANVSPRGVYGFLSVFRRRGASIFCLVRSILSYHLRRIPRNAECLKHSTSQLVYSLLRLRDSCRRLVRVLMKENVHSTDQKSYYRIDETISDQSVKSMSERSSQCNEMSVKSVVHLTLNSFHLHSHKVPCLRYS